MFVHAINIEWETDGVPADELGLPTEKLVEVDSAEDVADCLSDEFGWLVAGFTVRAAFEGEDDFRKKVERVVKVLRKYFNCDDDGNLNREFDGLFTAQDALDEIHSIVGKI